MSKDPFAQFKAAQREAWALFTPLATFTTPAAATLVDFAGIRRNDRVLDVACGTGVVTITAARRGASAQGVDLSPVLLEEAHRNAAVIGADVGFAEGDVEALDQHYPEVYFDAVLSQFGHMFAPRPDVAVAQMLKVLKPRGRIAFSTWPPELLIGSTFQLVAKYLPPPQGVAAPPAWGDPAVVRERLGDAVTDLQFQRDEITVPALSPQHYRETMERTAGPVIKLVDALAKEPARLAEFRSELDAIIERFFWRNQVHQSYLLTRAIKV